MKNILISCISLFTEKQKQAVDKYGNPLKPITYSSEDIEITAFQTNEACVKFLLKELAKSGETLDTYMQVQTDAVKNDKNNHTMQYLDDSIKAFCKDEGLTEPKNLPFSLGEDEKTHRYDKVLSEISGEIRKIADGDGEVSIYLDMAGGKRDNYIFIQLLTKLLSYYGYDVHTYYADLINRDDCKGEIVNTDRSFKHMEILDAVNEFVRFGSASSLRECFKGNNDTAVDDLLQAMERFSNSIQLCDTNLEKLITDLNETLDKIDPHNKDDLYDKDNLYVIRAMLPLIRDKFKVELGDKSRGTLNIIKWCLKNNLIQQALTIYNERAAEIIFKDKKLIEFEFKVPHKEKSRPGTDELVYILNEIHRKWERKGKKGSRANAMYDFRKDLLPERIKLNVVDMRFREILCDTQFAELTRNRVNHASGSDPNKEKVIELFKTRNPSYFSYRVAFTPGNIKKDLEEAVKRLEKALDSIDNA